MGGAIIRHRPRHFENFLESCNLVMYKTEQSHCELASITRNVNCVLSMKISRRFKNYALSSAIVALSKEREQQKGANHA